MSYKKKKKGRKIQIHYIFLDRTIPSLPLSQKISAKTSKIPTLKCLRQTLGFHITCRQILALGSRVRRVSFIFFSTKGKKNENY